MRPERSGRHPWRRSFGQTREFRRPDAGPASEAAPDPARDRGGRRATPAVRAAAALVAAALALAAVWTALRTLP